MLNIKNIYNTSDDNIDTDFFIPCLKWAHSYDRGIGYFTSGWLEKNSEGLSDFASRDGKIRWITSPSLSKEDLEFFCKYEDNKENYKYLSERLKNDLESIKVELSSDKLNLLGWMIYDEIVEIKFAIPKGKLTGDFHDKFGLFYKDEEIIGFSGSNNETLKGFNNYESFKVYTSWNGDLAKEFINNDKRRFERLWNNCDNNLIVHDMPKAVMENILHLRRDKRPYGYNKKNKWRHQEEAMKTFLKVGNGIINMATGTGKTRTALKIINELIMGKKVKRVVITVSGNDLLDQWYYEVISFFKENIVYRSYEKHKELTWFLYNEDEIVFIIISRSSLSKGINRFNSLIKEESILICDEIHGLGAEGIKSSLTGNLKSFKYRLGLSATPTREYDDDGNEFIKKEIGEILYTFSLEDAIKRGILCKIKYIKLEYRLTEEEKNKRYGCIKRLNLIKKNPSMGNLESVLIEISNIRKTAINKVYSFMEFIKSNTNILYQCIIFVKTKEYGQLLQEVLIGINDNYRTYFGEDNKTSLDEFINGEIDYLITSQKISEGVDIKSVKNIILFTSDRSLTQTTQRIGRALRIDENDIEKYATIIDFIDTDINDEDLENSEIKRIEWLDNLSKIGW